MEMQRQVLSETWQPEGFCLRVERVEKPDFDFVAITADPETFEAMDSMRQAVEKSPEFMEMESAYNLAGDYIGDVATARQLCGKVGVKPEKRSPDHNVCSIGFNEAEQKWYGWSHRAIHGFGIGSSVKKGDIAYVPVDREDARADAIRFWSDEGHLNTQAFDSVDADGRFCFRVEWTYADSIPNKALHGQISGVTHYPPEQFGRGEWTAETLEDAKRMAMDFAESIS